MIDIKEVCITFELKPKKWKEDEKECTSYDCSNISSETKSTFGALNQREGCKNHFKNSLFDLIFTFLDQRLSVNMLVWHTNQDWGVRCAGSSSRPIRAPYPPPTVQFYSTTCSDLLDVGFGHLQICHQKLLFVTFSLCSELTNIITVKIIFLILICKIIL